MLLSVFVNANKKYFTNFTKTPQNYNYLFDYQRFLVLNITYVMQNQTICLHNAKSVNIHYTLYFAL